jgi:hypothetical protein
MKRSLILEVLALYAVMAFLLVGLGYALYSTDTKSGTYTTTTAYVSASPYGGLHNPYFRSTADVIHTLPSGTKLCMEYWWKYNLTVTFKHYTIYDDLGTGHLDVYDTHTGTVTESTCQNRAGYSDGTVTWDTTWATASIPL